jgi:hypothetical protein
MNQLKNLKYQTMLVHGKLTVDIETSTTDLGTALDNEKSANIPQAWNKLPKSDKATLLNTFAATVLSTEYELTEEETTAAKEYLRSAIDRKKIQKNKDVVIRDGAITTINGLVFNKQSRRFTIKDTEHKQSTLKNLAPTKSSLVERKKKIEISVK